MKGKNKRSENMIVRVSEAEVAELEEKAAKAGMSKSNYIRESLKGTYIYPMKELQQLAREIIKTESTLNQISDQINQSPDSADAAVIDNLMDTEMKIKKSLHNIGVKLCR